MAEEQAPLNEEVLPDTDTTESDVETPAEVTAPTTEPLSPPLPEGADTVVTPDAPQAQVETPEEPIEDDLRPPAGPGVPDNPTRMAKMGEAWLKHSYPGDDKNDTKAEDESAGSWIDDALRVPLQAGIPDPDRTPGVGDGVESLIQYATMAAISTSQSPLSRSYMNMLAGEEYWPVASEVMSFFRAAPQAFSRGWNWANLHGAKWFTEGKGAFGDNYDDVVNIIDEDIWGGSSSTSTDIVGGIAAWAWGFAFFRKSVGMGAGAVGATGLTGSILGATNAPKFATAVKGLGGSWKGAAAYIARYGATITAPSIVSNVTAWDPRYGGVHHALASFWPEGERPPMFQSYLDTVGYAEPPGSYYGEDGKLLAGDLLTQQWLFFIEGVQFEIAGETVMRGVVFPLLKHFHTQALKGGTVGAGAQPAERLVQGGIHSGEIPLGSLMGRAVESPVVRMLLAQQIMYDMAVHGAMTQTYARLVKSGMSMQEARLEVIRRFPQGPMKAHQAELQANQLANTFDIELGQARNITNMLEVLGGNLDRLWIPAAGRNLLQIPGLEALLQESGVQVAAKLPVRAQESAARALGKALATGKVANNLDAKVQFLTDRASFPTDLMGSTVARVDGKAQPFMSPKGDFMKRVDRVFRDENKALRKGSGQLDPAAPARVAIPGQYEAMVNGIVEQAKRGAIGRRWYKENSEWVLEITGGNVDEATQFVGLLAITSKNASLASNRTMALQMRYAYGAGIRLIDDVTGAPLFGTRQVALDAIAWLEHGKMPEGLKRNAYYLNLMAHINPALVQGVTVDRHALRSLGYRVTKPSPEQYAYGERVYQEALDLFNKTVAPHIDDGTPWLAHELQGASFTDQLYRDKVLGGHSIKITRGDIPANTPPPPMKAVTYRTLGEQEQAIIYRQALPAADSGALPGLRAVVEGDPAAGIAYTREIDRVLIDENGVNQLATRVGLLQTSDGTLTFTGRGGPAMTETVPLVRAKGTDGPPRISDSAKRAARGYALGQMYVTKAGRTAYYTRIPHTRIEQANAMGFSVGKPLTQKQFDAIDSALVKEFGEKADRIHIGGGDKGEIHAVNFAGIPNKEFHNATRRIFNEIESTAGEGRLWAVDGDIIRYNWRGDPGGGGLLRLMGDEGLHSASGWLEDIAAPRLQSVSERVAHKHGLGSPGQYTTASGNKVPANASWGGSGTRVLLQSGEEAAAGRTVYGAAFISEADGLAMVQGIKGKANLATAIEETLGHAIRATVLNKNIPFAERLGGLTDDVIDEISEVFTRGGGWDTAAEERFAKAMVAYIYEGKFPANWTQEMKEGLSLLTAGLRDIYKEMKRVDPELFAKLAPEMRESLERLVTRPDLPVAWAPNKYFVLPPNATELLDRAAVIMAKGDNWMDDEEILGSLGVSVARRHGADETGFNPNVTRRFGDILAESSDPEKRALFAALANIDREVAARAQGMAPLSKAKGGPGISAEEMIFRNSQNLARLLGLPEDSIEETISNWFAMFRPEESGVAFTNVINAGNLMMRWQMEDVAKLAAVARRTMSVTDLALLQRAYINAEIWMRHVDAMATDWGRAGQALQGEFFPKSSALPSRETLMDPKRAAAFLEGSGLDVAANGNELISLVEEAVKVHGGTRGRRVVNDVLPRVIRESNRTIGSRATNMFMETYINALLSSPATSGFSGITTVSPALVTMVEGMQHFAGGLLPQALGGPPGYGQSIEAAYNFFRWFRNAKHGLTQMLRTYTNEGSIFLPNHEVIDAPRAQRKAISYGQGRPVGSRKGREGGNWMGQQGFMAPDTAAGDNLILWYLINSSGRGVRLPGNMISTTDELFRVANGRTALEADLYAKEMHKALADEGLSDANWLKKSAAVVRLHNDVAQRAKAGVERHISDGRLRTRTVLLEEAQQLPEVIKLREAGGSANGFKAMKIVREHLIKNWKGYTDEATGTVVPGLEAGVDVAAAGATTATFTGPVTSGLGMWFQTGLNKFPVLRVLVPFYRTPAKIFERFGGYLPTSMAVEGVNRAWGAARGHGWTIQPDSAIAKIHRVNMARLASGDARQIAIVRGQQAMGVAMFGAGYDLAASGIITGGGPANRDTRELWRQSGWRPYSVRIGDTYYSYKKIDPWAIALGTMADTYEYISASEGGGELEDEHLALVTAVMYSIVGNMQNKNMLQGLDNLLQLGRVKVETGGSLDSVLISMLTPTTPIANIDVVLARQILRAKHPALYEARTMLESLRTQTWIGMVSGPGETPIMRNILGEPLSLESMGEVDGTSWINMFVPSAISERTGDLVIEGLIDIDYPGHHPSMVKDNVRMLQYVGARESATPVLGEWTGLPKILSVPDPDWVDDEGLQPYDYWKREIGRVKLDIMGQKLTLRNALSKLFAGKSTKAQDYAALNEDTPGNRKTKREVVSDIINAYRAVAYLNTKNNKNADGSLAYEAWLIQIDAAREIMEPTVDRSAAGAGELAEKKRRDARDPRHTTQGSGTRNRNDIEDVVEKAGQRP